MKNYKFLYENNDTVDSYAKQKKLQKPELAIFDHLKEFISNAMILDIGVGAGRTSAYLMTSSKKYTGIDYSSSMINYCKKLYPNHQDLFSCGDARSMSQYKNESFDFILFSFNGIDSVPYDDRKLIFSEIFRILKKDGYFSFSSHNIRNIPEKYQFNFKKSLFSYHKELKRLVLTRKINGIQEKYADKSYVNFYDGAEKFKFAPLYIKPELQIEHLISMGFSDVTMYGLKSGNMISKNDLLNYTDAWLYYLCKKI